MRAHALAHSKEARSARSAVLRVVLLIRTRGLVRPDGYFNKGKVNGGIAILWVML
jgi:hypothetical protein